MSMYMYTCVCTERGRERETGFEFGGNGGKALDVGKQQTHAGQILGEKLALGLAGRVHAAVVVAERSEERLLG